MKRKRHLCIKLIIFVIGLPLLFSPSYLFSSKALAFSVDDERKMGQEFLLQIRRQFELLDDDFANQFFKSMSCVKGDSHDFRRFLLLFIGFSV